MNAQKSKIFGNTKVENKSLNKSKAFLNKWLN